ncbi:hypothetical protein ZEAMMB73_Zm00001d045628 [Zea mays]|uniref:Uncharacterized protein n=1 Tax=Zea mays TaxID=4577 RepID=A0A1D6NXT3_MAIZE|nr:hypothetical protein ZEAMMB73_Zm00001d045628 [Zea mays]
MAWSKNWSNNG